MKLWVQERGRMGVRNDGYIDELPMQSAILHHANQGRYRHQCDPKVKQVTGTGFLLSKLALVKSALLLTRQA